VVSGFARFGLAAETLNAETIPVSLAPLVGVRTQVFGLIVDANNAIIAPSVPVCNLTTVSHADGCSNRAAIVGIWKSKPIIICVRADRCWVWVISSGAEIAALLITRRVSGIVDAMGGTGTAALIRVCTSTRGLGVDAFEAEHTRIGVPSNLIIVVIHAVRFVFTAALVRRTPLSVRAKRFSDDNEEISGAFNSFGVQCRVRVITLEAKRFVTRTSPICVPCCIHVPVVDTEGAMVTRIIPNLNLYTVCINAVRRFSDAALVGVDDAIPCVTASGELTFTSASELGCKNFPLREQESSMKGA
jgi:hypothetical protein